MQTDLERIFCIYLAVSLMLPLRILAQPLPVTNIYCAHIRNSQQAESWLIGKLEMLNGFNLNSYNNQPFFINENEMLCSAQLIGSSHTDIYRLNLSNHELLKLINDEGKDYSPRLHPDGSGDITCVHIEARDTIQNVCTFDGRTGRKKNDVLKNSGQIGYYRHLDKDKWVCFLVEKPNNLLSIINQKTGEKKIFASSIGRTFEVLSPQEILFVHKILDDHWELKSYHPETQKMITLATMPPGSEDFAIGQGGAVFCTYGGQIKRLNKSDSTWKTVADLSKLGLKHLQRMTIMGQRALIVDEPR